MACSSAVAVAVAVLGHVWFEVTVCCLLRLPDMERLMPTAWHSTSVHFVCPFYSISSLLSRRSLLKSAAAICRLTSLYILYVACVVCVCVCVCAHSLNIAMTIINICAVCPVTFVV